MGVITFEDIVNANTCITTTPIKGKNYAEVNQRIKAFRMLYPAGCIETDLVSDSDGKCIFRSTVKDDLGNILGQGTAFENQNSGFINKTSYIENCETSAVGRALAMCGIGIDVSIASAEELSNALLNQEEKQEENHSEKKTKPSESGVEEAALRASVIGYINRHKFDAEKIGTICRAYKVQKLVDLTADNCRDYIKKLEEKGLKIDE